MKPSAGERVTQVLLALLKSICYLTLFLGSQVLVMLPVIAASALQWLMGGTVDEDAVNAMLNEQAMSYSLLANLLTLVIVLVFYLVRRKKFSEALWLRHVDAPTLWEGVALAPGLYLVVNAVLASLPESWLDSYNDASSGITSGGFVGAVAVVVAAPVVEEIIFRGLIMTRLSRAMPVGAAMLLSAAIFGICHGNAVWFGYAFVLGTLFGYMDLRAGSIWPSILGHVAFNSFSQIISVLPDSDTAAVIFLAVLLIAAVAAPILDRRAVVALFRRPPKEAAVPALPTEPQTYDYDPWDV